ncbi:MAG: YheC/YheD family protein [Alicyclobacillus macrosporangiidus]|uniref:YheC/YheD family endospore coat-associated protein n=1 Tax=Alicyclobacillus macrosporangiidus TaxID=392015 RepID=UPI0026F0F4F4|nr:YheC/YheD family protein [Alicyclobacillus macrosporangiidus]MCL6597292.1 YheC/YheD family protein [Alicyclobacillus macrosporangiidus]
MFLGLPADAVRARLQDGMVRVGPTIGILCNPVWNEKRQTLRWTKQLPALEKLVQAGQKLGALVYIFGIQDVDFDRGTVRAFVFQGGSWRPARMPLPDAIYDQVVSRKLERSKKYQDQRMRLSRMYANRIFNDGFFDKWKVHEWLWNDRQTRWLVPYSEKYTNPRQAAAFLKRYPVTFVKPVHGSLGLGIVRVTREADGTFRYEVRHKSGRTQNKVGTAEAVVDAIRRRLQQTPHLLQEGVPVAQFRGRPFDVRIVLQRDGSGAWKRTKMFVRVARAGEFTANLASGGVAMPLDAVLREAFASEEHRRRIRSQVRRAAGWVASVIESQCGKPLGELGVDLAIDESGKVWVLEVNSKPWKASSTDKGRQDLVDLSFTRPMEYAIRLAQQR